MVEFGEFPELETKRLVLRRMTLADAEFYLRHFSDPDIVELTAFDAPENIDKARQELFEFCIKPFEENKGIRWGIVLKGETELAGTIGYHRWVKAGGYHARAGYDLAAAYRRRGVMTCVSVLTDVMVRVEVVVNGCVLVTVRIFRLSLYPRNVSPAPKTASTIMKTRIKDPVFKPQNSGYTLHVQER
jgi:hypothetical protein